MGKIIVAGIGPGDKADTTPAVLEAMREADAIVGYKYYFQFAKPYLKEGCECIDTGMKKERERAEQAFCLAEEWREGYDEAVTMPPPPFPKGMAEKYYIAAEQYFDAFDGFGDDWEVVSAEKKFVLRLGKYDVSGIADLVLRNKNTGELWVVDHKSKSMNSLRKELNLYRKQLYLYAMWCKEEFGAYPVKISFNMFKEGCFVDEEFSLDALDETKKWFLDTIHQIEDIDALECWETKVNSYFCGNICSLALECADYQQLRQEELDRYYAKKALEAEMYGV